MNGPATLHAIGDSLRLARDRAGYTLDQLAERSGLSKAHLSRMECGERQPSVATLVTLSRTLRVPVGTLLGEEPEPSGLAIFERNIHPYNARGLAIEACSGFAGSQALEALSVRITPDRNPPPFACHRGEEWLNVLAGTLQLEYGGETHLLQPGQSAHFDAGRPHRLGARAEPVEFLLVTADIGNDVRRTH